MGDPADCCLTLTASKINPIPTIPRQVGFPPVRGDFRDAVTILKIRWFFMAQHLYFRIDAPYDFLWPGTVVRAGRKWIEVLGFRFTYDGRDPLGSGQPEPNSLTFSMVLDYSANLGVNLCLKGGGPPFVAVFETAEGTGHEENVVVGYVLYDAYVGSFQYGGSSSILPTISFTMYFDHIDGYRVPWLAQPKKGWSSSSTT